MGTGTDVARRKWFWEGCQAAGRYTRIDRCYKLVLRAVLFVAVYSLLTLAAMAQEPAGKAGEPQKLTAPAIEELSSSAPAKVDVSPVAHDEEIVKRLQSILHATNWFTDPKVRVAEGVVFLSGQVESEEIKKWAGNLARNTQDVVAVVNRVEVIEPPVWNFRPALNGLMMLWRDFIRSLPYIIFGLLVLALSVGAGKLATGVARSFLHRRIRTKLLQNVIAYGAGGLVFL
ncbi:MAG: BON domain-containing protein, partial [Verrucomicrobia bacterium]|nr:BON domain-containing protein [Deltaproteobacteria bacterium]